MFQNILDNWTRGEFYYFYFEWISKPVETGEKLIQNKIKIDRKNEPKMISTKKRPHFKAQTKKKNTLKIQFIILYQSVKL